MLFLHGSFHKKEIKFQKAKWIFTKKNVEIKSTWNKFDIILIQFT